MRLAPLPTPYTSRHTRSGFPPLALSGMPLLRLPCQVLLLNMQGLLRQGPGSSCPRKACSLSGGLPEPPASASVCPTQTSSPSTHPDIQSLAFHLYLDGSKTQNQYIQTSHHSLNPLLLLGSPSQCGYQSPSNEGTGPTPAWGHPCSYPSPPCPIYRESSRFCLLSLF